MPLLTIEQRRAIIASHKLDPNKHRLDDNGDIVELQLAQPAVNAVQTAGGAGADESSALGSFGRQAKRSAIPTFAGIGGAALGAAATPAVLAALAIPATGGLSAIAIPLLAGIGAGAGAGYAQDKLNPLDATQQAQQQLDLQRHPYASFAGEVAPSALAFRPSLNALRGVRSIRQTALSQRALTPLEKANLLNVGIGTTLPIATEGIVPALQGHDVDYKHLAASMATGAVFSEPWALGTKLFGFTPTAKAEAHPTIEGAGKIAAENPELFTQQTRQPASRQPISEEQIAQMLGVELPKPAEEQSGEGHLADYLMAEKRKQNIQRQLTVEQLDAALRQPQGNALRDLIDERFPAVRDMNSTRENVVIAARLKQRELEFAAKEKAEADAVRKTAQVRVQDRRGVDVEAQDEVQIVNPPEIIKPAFEKTIDRPAPRVSDPRLPSKYQLSPAEARAGGLPPKGELRSSRDITGSGRSLYSDKSALSHEQQAAAETRAVLERAGEDVMVSKNPGRRVFGKLLARYRGVTSKEGVVRDKLGMPLVNKDGSLYAGEADTAARTSLTNPDTATVGTESHEIYHNFNADIVKRGTAAERKLIADGERMIGASEKYSAHENSTRLVELEATRRATERRGRGTSDTAEAFKDIAAWARIKSGRGVSQDYTRLLARKLLYDPSFREGLGTFDAKSVRPVYRGAMKDENEKPLHLFNLSEDITDGDGNVLHPKDSTVSEETLKRFEVDYDLQAGETQNSNKSPLDNEPAPLRPTPKQQKLGNEIEMDMMLKAGSEAYKLASEEARFAKQIKENDEAGLETQEETHNDYWAQDDKTQHTQDQLESYRTGGNMRKANSDKSALLSDDTRPRDEFIPTAPTVARDLRLAGAGNNVINALKNKLSPSEFSVLEKNGLGEFLATPKKNAELVKWLEENGAKDGTYNTSNPDIRYSNESPLTAPEVTRLIDESAKTPSSTIHIPFLESALDKAARTQGREGRYIAPILRKVAEARDSFMGKFNLRVRNLLGKNFSAGELASLNDALLAMRETGTDQILSTPKLQNAYDETKQILSDIGDERLKYGVPVWDYTKSAERPTPRALKKDSFYYMHMIDIDVLRELRNNPSSPKATSLYSDMVEHLKTKRLITEDEASAIVDSIISTSQTQATGEYNALRVQEGVGLPLSWIEKNPLKALDRYTKRTAADLAIHNSIQVDPIARQILGMKEDPWGKKDNTKTWADSGEKIHNRANTPDITEIMRKVRMEYTDQEAWFNAVSGVAKAMFIGPLSKIKDITSNIPLLSQYAEPSQIPGMIVAAIKNARHGLQIALEQGFAQKGISAAEMAVDIGDGAVERLHALRDTMNRVQGAELAEEFSRGIATAGAEFLVRDNIYRATHGLGANKEKAVKFLMEFSNGEITAKNASSATTQQINEAAIRLAQRVQATYDYRDLPTWMLGSGYMPAVFTLSKWGIAQTNNFVKQMQRDPIKVLTTGLLGAAIGGTLNKEISELVNQKKLSIPTWDEINEGADSEKGKLALYNLTATLQYAGFAGVLTDYAKMMQDVMNKNRANPIAAPAAEVVSEVISNTADAISAIAEGENAPNVLAELAAQLARNNVQSARLMMNLFGKPEEKLRKERQRDLRAYEMTSGLPYADYRGTFGNPYTGLEAREFKRNTNLEEAIPQGQTLVQKALQDARTSEDAAGKLQGLRNIQTRWMPSPKSAPLEFFEYISYVRKTQGDAEAQKLVNDFYAEQARNEVKKSFIPSMSAGRR